MIAKGEDYPAEGPRFSQAHQDAAGRQDRGELGGRGTALT